MLQAFGDVHLAAVGAGSCSGGSRLAETGPWSQWVVPLQMRLLDGGTSEGHGQPFMSAPTVFSMRLHTLVK